MKKQIKNKNFNSAKHCFYCNCYDKKVEASGIFYCPNPKCYGPGVNWFAETLKSYRSVEDGYFIDTNEKEEKGNEYIKNRNLNLTFIVKHKIRENNFDKNKEINKTSANEVEEIKEVKETIFV